MREWKLASGWNPVILRMEWIRFTNGNDLRSVSWKLGSAWNISGLFSFSGLFGISGTKKEYTDYILLTLS
jgi:hypothetical protein